MFVDNVKQTFVGAICTVKHFAFSVKNKFLQVEGNCLGNAKVFCILRYVYFDLFTYPEKMVNSMTACEDNGSVVGYFNFLPAEFFCSDAFNNDKGMEIQFNVMLFCQIEIWRFFPFRFWLSN